MSHLFKGKNKKFFKTIIFIFLILITFLFFEGLKNYTGNKLNFLTFSLISNYLLFFAFRKHSIFFETFFSLFLWLGFWFKFTIIISFTDGIFREGVGYFDYLPSSYDKTLLVSQIGFLAFIMGCFLREKLLFVYPQKIFFNKRSNNFIIKYKNSLWISFVLLFLLIGFVNFYFKIYQKGLIPFYDLNFIMSGIVKWLLLFGLASFSAILIFWETINFKKIFFSSFMIIIIEPFVSSISMLSRGMIFNSLSILFGFYKFSKKISIKININFYLKIISLTFILFYISVISVNYLRINYFYEGKSIKFVNENEYDANKKSDYSKFNSEILYLAVNRWVGIDGVMAVISKKEILGTSFIKKSLSERLNVNQPTFYEQEFGLEDNYLSNKLYKNVKGNTTPGIIAYIFYSGSLILLFLFIFLISILFSMIEIFAFKLSGKNLIFSALIGQILAYRLTHFGYLPLQSYLLLGTIFITILFLYFLNKILEK